MNKNAKVIIPFVLVAWLGSLVVFRAGTPAVVGAAFVVAVAVAIPVMVFYLMAEMGWSTLAKRFRVRGSFGGAWRAAATGQMATVSVFDPVFQRKKLRLVGGTLRLGTSREALHLSMLFSKIPILGRFFPDVQIPWSAVTTATTFEAPGWFTPLRDSGTILQVAYDPNYTGTFVELVVGEPPVFLQLPADLLGEGMTRLPLSSTP
ncbi:MAG TPA: hypothetical protein VEW45_03190 [Candidatus Dormibacteraeota bacterium]|nr:hypothetical protein [Candidatus Dormibacteraeota bacterium]